MTEKEKIIFTTTERPEQKLGLGKYVTSLKGLDLGQKNAGIKSDLSQVDTISRYASLLQYALVEAEDEKFIACIDGRKTICQLNGDKDVARMRIAGGILSYYIGEILSADYGRQPLDTNHRLYSKFLELEKMLNEILNIFCSSHSGGCGASEGLINHLRVINAPHLAKSTQEVMDLIKVDDSTQFDSMTYQEVARQAKNFANGLEEVGWNGDEFLSFASKQAPAGVEKLEYDSADNLHGHKEQAIILVTGKKTISKNKLLELGLGQAFVININLIYRMATCISKPTGKVSNNRALHSLVAYQLAVAHNLCNENMPIFVI